MRFNPRARAGRDSASDVERVGVCVSIHAPARGATAARLHSSRQRIRFNPRARAGRDH